MELFKLFLLLLTCYLETNIFPDLLKTYLHPTVTLFCITFIGAFFAFKDLRKHSLLAKFFVIGADLIICLNGINHFIDSSFIPLHQTHYFLVYGVIIFAFLFAKTRDFKQLDNSFVFSNLFYSFFTNIIVIYCTFYSLHYNQGKYLELTGNLNAENIITLVKAYFIDILLLANFVININMIRIFNNKSKNIPKSVYVMNIVKRLGSHVVLSCVFYACYNDAIRSAVYDLVMKNLPQPHNVIVYNMLPSNPDQKFRLVAAVVFYLTY
jgi:hypothetical protein